MRSKPDHDETVSDVVDGVPTAKNQKGITLADLDDEVRKNVEHALSKRGETP